MDVEKLGDAERDRFGKIVFRFFFGRARSPQRASGDPHPGNDALLADGCVGFSTRGSCASSLPASRPPSTRSRAPPGAIGSPISTERCDR